MKKHLRLFLINSLSLWLAAYLLPGVSYAGGWQTLAWTALVLTLVNFLVKPIVKVLLLPINLLTLGAFRWLINVAVLYLVAMIIPQFKITAFVLSGFSYQGFVVPSVHLGIFWAHVAASLLISFSTTFLLWLIKN
jgi:putative membrane protein